MRMPPHHLSMPSDGGPAPRANANSSPKNRIKFLCSHGGKILPRPTDGQIKYVGGETRVISVDRDISFRQLMKKLTYLINDEMILKYQVVSEDLDALVSVKTDEDVGHMFDEITNWENAGSSRLRAFLFPANPVLVDNQIGPVDPLALEQQYVDAINGILRCAPRQTNTNTNTNTVRPGFFISSSAGSSPSQRSPESCATINETTAPAMSCYQNNNRMINMHKVRSSPNICMNFPQQHNHHHAHHYANHYSTSTHQSPNKPIFDHQRSEKFGRAADGARHQPDLLPTPSPPHYYPNTSKQNRGGNGGYTTTKGGLHYEESSSHFSDRKMMERARSRAMSPVPSFAHLAHTHGVAGWEV